MTESITQPVSTLSPEGLNARLESYHVLCEVGRGAMGIVYEARQSGLQRRVALKVLPPTLTLRERTVKRFLREAAAMGRLAHANIVDVYEVGSIGDLHFFAMQFVEGPPLDRVIKAGPLAIVDVVQIGIDVASALAHAHARGVLHRDIKPANLLRDGDRVVLTDFGLARPLDTDDDGGAMTESGDLVGTPLYMSPEQISGDAERIDGRSDVWGLGATLYELLAQRPPFGGQNAQAILNCILHRDPPLLRKLRDDVPRDLEAVILKCLEKDVGRRYSGAAGLVEDLKAVREGRAVSASTPRFFDPAVRWTRRHPMQAGLALAVMVIVGVLSLKWSQSSRALDDQSKKLEVEQKQHKEAVDLGDRLKAEKLVASARSELLRALAVWDQGVRNKNARDQEQASERVTGLLQTFPPDEHPDVAAETLEAFASMYHQIDRDDEVLAAAEGMFAQASAPTRLAMRAAMLTGLGRYEDALREHRQRSRLNSRAPEPYLDAGLVLRKLALATRDVEPQTNKERREFFARLQDAVRALDTALELAVFKQDENMVATILIERARCFFELGQMDRARANLEMAREHDPTRADARTLLIVLDRAKTSEVATEELPPVAATTPEPRPVEPHAAATPASLPGFIQQINVNALKDAQKNLGVLGDRLRDILRGERGGSDAAPAATTAADTGGNPAAKDP